MVLFLDLTSSRFPVDSQQYIPREVKEARAYSAEHATEPKFSTEDRSNPNVNHPLAALTAVYPFLSSLAQHLDHTDLYNLSSTCRQVHANMSSFRRPLLEQSLCCMNKRDGRSTDAPIHYAARTCVRDLVNRCLCCKEPLCRNCVTKPNPTRIKLRYRRLCVSCQTSSHPLRTCTCPTNAWICRSCSKKLAEDDDAYITYWDMWEKSYRGEPLDCFTGRFMIHCPRGTDCVGIDITENAVQKKEISFHGQMHDRHAALTDFKSSFENLFGKGKYMNADGGRKVDYMGESSGQWNRENRTWCSWCDSVILSRADRVKAGLEVEGF